MNDNFSHIVVVDRASRTLKVERLYPDGRRELFTITDIPKTSSDCCGDVVSVFALKLGENLLLDSPAARELLGL
jgi:hypothetical protein